VGDEAPHAGAVVTGQYPAHHLAHRRMGRRDGPVLPAARRQHTRRVRLPTAWSTPPLPCPPYNWPEASLRLGRGPQGRDRLRRAMCPASATGTPAGANAHIAGDARCASHSGSCEHATAGRSSSDVNSRRVRSALVGRRSRTRCPGSPMPRDHVQASTSARAIGRQRATHLACGDVPNSMSTPLFHDGPHPAPLGHDG